MREVLAILAVVLTVACGEERRSDAELQAAVDAFLQQDVGLGAGDAKLGADGDVGDAADLSDGEVGADGASDGSACKGVCGNSACDCGETVANCAVDCKAGPPTGMVLIPAGTFWMGCNASKDSNCAANEKPQHKVTLSAYYMDLTETTVGQYKACVDVAGCSTPSLNTYATYPDQTNNPVNYVDWAQAQAYCKWRGAGFNLPTEAQWEMAARGTCEKNGSTAGDKGCAAAMRTYPWGETTPTASHAVFGLPSTAQVGSSLAGDSPFGLQDMAGNVWEWTRDWYGLYSAGDVADPMGPSSGTTRITRGGGFGVDAFWLGAGRRAGGEPPYAAYKFLGFRCIRSYP